jgi:hypothetical protein
MKYLHAYRPSGLLFDDQEHIGDDEIRSLGQHGKGRDISIFCTEDTTLFDGSITPRPR